MIDLEGIGLAWLDLSAGTFRVTELDDTEALRGELERLRLAECLVSEEAALPDWLREMPGLRRRPPWHYDADSARRLLCGQFGTQDLSGFGCDALTTGIGAAGCLLQYVHDTQRTALPHIRSIGVERPDDALILDAATRRNLELEFGLAGQDKHTLAGVMDRSITALGSRGW